MSVSAPSSPNSFTERLQIPDLRLDCAILRPMKSEHDSFLAYYLTQDDVSAINFKERRSTIPPYEVPENQEDTLFEFVRDYETVKVEQEVPNEFLLLLNDGSPSNGNEPAGQKRKGAYYKNIERKMFLKKKRTMQHEQYEDKWNLIHLTHMEISKEEEEERQEALAEVADPMYLMGRVDAYSEGDPEMEVVPSGTDIWDQ